MDSQGNTGAASGFETGRISMNMNAHSQAHSLALLILPNVDYAIIYRTLG